MLQEVFNNIERSHNEPEIIRVPCKSLDTTFEACWFQGLQELYACVMLGFDWEHYLVARLEDNSSDQFIDIVMENEIGMESHLICHSSEGLYIPKKGGAEIRNPHYSDISPGGWICSSDVLVEELVHLSAVLGIDLIPMRGVVRRGGGMDISVESKQKLEQCSKRTLTSSHEDEKKRLLDQLCHMWHILFYCAKLSSTSGSALIMLPYYLIVDQL